MNLNAPPVAEPLRVSFVNAKTGDRIESAVRRNAPCLCGSGRKFKRCCLLGVRAAGRSPAELPGWPLGPDGKRLPGWGARSPLFHPTSEDVETADRWEVEQGIMSRREFAAKHPGAKACPSK